MATPTDLDWLGPIEDVQADVLTRRTIARLINGHPADAPSFWPS